MGQLFSSHDHINHDDNDTNETLIEQSIKRRRLNEEQFESDRRTHHDMFSTSMETGNSFVPSDSQFEPQSISVIDLTNHNYIEDLEAFSKLAQSKLRNGKVKAIFLQAIEDVKRLSPQRLKFKYMKRFKTRWGLTKLPKVSTTVRNTRKFWFYAMMVRQYIANSKLLIPTPLPIPPNVAILIEQGASETNGERLIGFVRVVMAMRDMGIPLEKHEKYFLGIGGLLEGSGTRYVKANTVLPHIQCRLDIIHTLMVKKPGEDRNELKEMEEERGEQSEDDDTEDDSDFENDIEEGESDDANDYEAESDLEEDVDERMRKVQKKVHSNKAQSKVVHTFSVPQEVLVLPSEARMTAVPENTLVSTEKYDDGKTRTRVKDMLARAKAKRKQEDDDEPVVPMASSMEAENSILPASQCDPIAKQSTQSAVDLVQCEAIELKAPESTLSVNNSALNQTVSVEHRQWYSCVINDYSYRTRGMTSSMTQESGKMLSEQLTISSKKLYGGLLQGWFKFMPIVMKRSSESIDSAVWDEILTLNHPNVVTTLAIGQGIPIFGEENSHISPTAILMEYASRGSLYALLHSDVILSIEERIRIARNLARGLAYLHSRPIVHGDIKSLNVVIDESGEPKWCDLGVLEPLKCGTLRWMAPEQLLAADCKPSLQSDMWSFGMLCFEIMTRSLPFADALVDFQINQWISDGNGEVIPAWVDEKIPSFGQLMRSCWNKYQDRPDADKVLFALEDIHQTLCPSKLYIKSTYELSRGSKISETRLSKVYLGSFQYKPVVVKQLKQVANKHVLSLATITQLLTLQHSNIVQIYDILAHTATVPTHTIVMEYCGGGSLYHYLHSDASLSVKQMLSITRDLSRGLAYLHSQELVHGDIKSLNVVLSDNLVAKWCDFGMGWASRAKQGKVPPQLPTDITGLILFPSTLRWMSPELVSGTASTPTLESDIWAFGMVCFELVTRKVPFVEANTDLQVNDWILEGTGEVIPQWIEKDLPKYGQLMRKCWLKCDERINAIDINDMIEAMLLYTGK